MSSQTLLPNTEATILARLIQSHDQELAPEVARYLLSIEFAPADIKRVDELSEKARDGLLTAVERSELDSYLHVGNLLTVMQSKARHILKQVQADSSSRS